MNRASVAVVPGSFDPITNGHIDIIRRATEMCDRVIVGVLMNLEKKALFSVEERVEMIQELFTDEERIEVQSFEGLLVRFGRQVGAGLIVRGIRAISDYEYELQMALMNRRLAPEIDTVFLLPKEEYSYLSSRLVKEIATHDGSVEGLVPPAIEKRLKDRLVRG